MKRRTLLLAVALLAIAACSSPTEPAGLPSDPIPPPSPSGTPTVPIPGTMNPSDDLVPPRP